MQNISKMKLKDFEEGASEKGDCGTSMESKPSWLDIDKFNKGQEFMQKHKFAYLLSLHFSLVIGFTLPNLLDPLVFTKMSDTPQKALKRYLLTLHHVLAWITGDVWDVNNRAHKSLKMVRGMHNQVANSMNTGEAQVKHVSQYDMALVQSGFMAAALMYHKHMGVYPTKGELENFVYYWRGLGYLLGIDDKYNLCQGDYEQTYSLCREVERNQLLPRILNPENTPKNFEKMVTAYCDGINISMRFPLHSWKADAAVVLTFMGVPIPWALGFRDRVRIYFWRALFFLVKWCPGLEKLCNGPVVWFLEYNSKNFITLPDILK